MCVKGVRVREKVALDSSSTCPGSSTQNWHAVCFGSEKQGSHSLFGPQPCHWKPLFAIVPEIMGLVSLASNLTHFWLVSIPEICLFATMRMEQVNQKYSPKNGGEKW